MDTRGKPIRNFKLWNAQYGILFRFAAMVGTIFQLFLLNDILFISLCCEFCVQFRELSSVFKCFSVNINLQDNLFPVPFSLNVQYQYYCTYGISPQKTIPSQEHQSIISYVRDCRKRYTLFTVRNRATNQTGFKLHPCFLIKITATASYGRICKRDVEEKIHINRSQA